MPGTDRKPPQPKNEFTDALKKGLLIGAVLLVLILPALRVYQQRQQAPQPPVATVPQAPAAAPPVAQAPPAQAPADPQAAAPQEGTPPVAAPDTEIPGSAQPPLRRADFSGEEPSADAQHVADWVVFTGDNGKHAFVLIDKKEARAYVFTPQGKLKESTPVLLGSARGDDSAPGIGDKPLSAIKPHEKTTPAGRYVAEPGLNASREDIVWVDYDAAVSMHRIRPTNPRERRLERMASMTVDDNRISYGCVNMPVRFYEDVLSPAVRRSGAIVYVLPETRSPQEQFGSFDVGDPAQVARWQQAALKQQASTRARSAAAPRAQKVALQD